MKILTQNDVTNNGLNWIKSLDQFEFRLSHWTPEPLFFKEIDSLFTYSIESFGGTSNHGCDIYTFTRKPTEQQLLEKLESDIKSFADSLGIKVLIWEYKK